MKHTKSFNCVNCGSVWTDYISNDKNKRFCSVRCKSIYSRTDRICKNCSKVFSICKSVLRTNASGNYCCRKCYIQKMTTGLTKNKGGFRYLSKKLFPEPRYCAICGRGNDIHIHHIEAYKYTQNNDKANLIPLCKSHHKIVEVQTEKLLLIDNDRQRVWFIIKNILLQRWQETKSLL